MTPEEVLEFWLDEVGESAWYKSDPDLDARIRDRFQATWEAAMEGRFGLWLTYPSGALAYIILTDQFPRNMFRGDARSFATDGIARGVAKAAIAKGWDEKIDGMARQFFYLPMMHSENLSDQDRAVRLIATRMPDGGEANLIHAKAHREIIRKFGRFPYRNEALGRETRECEVEFMENGGYGATMRELQGEAA